MPRHRSHSVAFKRRAVEEYLAGATLQGLAKRHDISRNLIRVWLAKDEAGAFDDDAQAADLLQAYEARIAALVRGSQHAASRYRELLAEHGLIGSMGRLGKPYAMAESLMKTLEVEAVYPMAYETFEDVAADLPRFLGYLYNPGRLHSAFYLSPVRLEEHHARTALKPAA